MAASERRIVLVEAGGAFQPEFEDFQRCKMLRARDGGDVTLDISMKRSFRDYQRLNKWAKSIHLYQDDKFKGEFRVRTLKSDLASNTIDIKCEGRSEVLRDIKGEITIQASNPTYTALFTGPGTTIDVGQVAKILYNTFIAPFGSPAGFTGQLASSFDIDLDTGHFIKFFQWGQMPQSSISSDSSRLR